MLSVGWFQAANVPGNGLGLLGAQHLAECGAAAQKFLHVAVLGEGLRVNKAFLRKSAAGLPCLEIVVRTGTILDDAFAEEVCPYQFVGQPVLEKLLKFQSDHVRGI